MPRKYAKKARRAAGFGLCTLFCLAAGCGAPQAPGTTAPVPQSDSPQNTTAPAATQAPLTGELTVYLEATYATDIPDYPIRQAMKQFEAENPGLTVQYESPGGAVSASDVWEADITRLSAEVMAGGGPDVFLFGYRFTDVNLFGDPGKAMENGAFLDCGGLLAQRGVDVYGDDFLPTVMAAGRSGGAQYILPLTVETVTALCAGDTLAQSGFDTAAAGAGTAAFAAQAAAVYAARPALDTCWDADVLDCLSFDLLDRREGVQRLTEGAALAQLALQQETAQAAWSSGWRAEGALATAQGCSYWDYWDGEAARLAGGERLMDVLEMKVNLSTAFQLAANGTPMTFLPLPDEQGGVAARVSTWAAINANTKNPDAAAALAAYLLSAERQSAAAWPSSSPELPVRRDSLAAALESYQNWLRDSWLNHPTPQQLALYRQETGAELTAEDARAEAEMLRRDAGAALSDTDVQSLAALLEKITITHLNQSALGGVDLGKTADGSDLLEEAWQALNAGELTPEGFAALIAPRLELYLKE